MELLKAKILEGEIPVGEDHDYAGVTVDFHLPVPKSWSKKEKTRVSGTMHRVKFDVDNGAKAFLDSMEEAGVFFNDSRISQLTARKWYCKLDELPRIVFSLQTHNQLLAHVY
ncbi:MAG: hypothetical protein NVS3B25_25080 [Hymenobacter sp.]